MNQAKHCKGIVGNNVFQFGYEHRLGPFVGKHPNGLSGAEKRRKRKGGNPKGGPGSGGIQGAMRRLAEGRVTDADF